MCADEKNVQTDATTYTTPHCITLYTTRTTLHYNTYVIIHYTPLLCANTLHSTTICSLVTLLYATLTPLCSTTLHSTILHAPASDADARCAVIARWPHHASLGDLWDMNRVGGCMSVNSLLALHAHKCIYICIYVHTHTHTHLYTSTHPWTRLKEGD